MGFSLLCDFFPSRLADASFTCARALGSVVAAIAPATRKRRFDASDFSCLLNEEREGANTNACLLQASRQSKQSTHRL